MAVSPVVTTEYINTILKHGEEAKENIRDTFYHVRRLAVNEHEKRGSPLVDPRQWTAALWDWTAMWRQLSGKALGQAALDLIEGILGWRWHSEIVDEVHMWLAKFDERIQFGLCEGWRRNYCKAMDFFDVTDEVGCTLRLQEGDRQISLNWLRHGSRRRYKVRAETNCLVNITALIVPAMALEEDHFRDFESVETVDMARPQLTRGLFCNCRALRSPPIPVDAEEIPAYCFAGCVAMTAVSLPASVIHVEPFAFASSGVEVADLGNCRFFGSHCFYQTSLRTVKLPLLKPVSGRERSCVVRVGTFAFARIPNLVHVDLGGVHDVADCSFTQCTALTMITIPPSVTNVGSGAFRECDLRRITVAPRTIPMKVAAQAFAFNRNLRAVDASAMILKNAMGNYLGMQFFKCAEMTLAVLHPEAVKAYHDDDLVFAGVKGFWKDGSRVKWFAPVPEEARIRGQAKPGEITRLTAVTIADGLSMDPLPFLHCHVEVYRWLWQFVRKHQVGGLPNEMWAAIVGYLAPVDEERPW